jgi:hypothetical protein
LAFSGVIFLAPFISASPLAIADIKASGRTSGFSNNPLAFSAAVAAGSSSHP